LDLQLPVQSVPITAKVTSPGTPVSSTNKTDRHNIAEILLKVELNTIKQTNVIVARHLSMAWDFIGQFKYLFCMLRSASSVKLILSLSDPQLTPATVQIQYCNSLNSMKFGIS